MAATGREDGAWLLPTWTLAVEQQFYALLPLLVLTVPARRLPAALALGIALGPAFRLAVAAAGLGPLPGFVLLPARADLLLWGVAAALLRHRGATVPGGLTTLRVVPLACALALVALAALDRVAGTALFAQVGPTAVGLGCAVFILGIVQGAPEGQRYRSGTWRFFGTISYALYLVHQPVAGLLHGLLREARPDIASPAAIAATALAFALSVALAALSWRLLEAPLLRRARTWRPAPEPLRA